jgi:rhamnulokinase
MRQTPAFVAGRAAAAMESSRAYETTGIRSMPFNTVCQLLAQDSSAALKAAYPVALIPDLLAYWLCGAGVGQDGVRPDAWVLAP